MHPTDYEALTVAELREMADQLGLEIPHDARKADIIEALRSEMQKQGKQPGQKLDEVPDKPASEETESGKQRISSTGEEVELSKEDFWRLKLIS